MNRTQSAMRPKAIPQVRRRTLVSLGVTCAFAAVGTMLVAPDADARLTKLQITSRGPAFGGFSFPGVGTYERIVGTYVGELSPTDPHNSVITDIALAPFDANPTAQ